MLLVSKLGEFKLVKLGSMVKALREGQFKSFLFKVREFWLSIVFISRFKVSKVLLLKAEASSVEIPLFYLSFLDFWTSTFFFSRSLFSSSSFNTLSIIIVNPFVPAFSQIC